MRRLWVPGMAVLVLGTLGCGDGIKRVPVKGKLTARGNPIEGAVVQFIPHGGTKGEGGVGQTNQRGDYSLQGLNSVTGVAPGDYVVRVSRIVGQDGNLLPPGAVENDYPGCYDSIPPPYGGPKPTLKATVPEAGAVVDLDLPVKLLTSAPRR